MNIAPVPTKTDTPVAATADGTDPTVLSAADLCKIAAKAPRHQKAKDREERLRTLLSELAAHISSHAAALITKGVEDGRGWTAIFGPADLYPGSACKLPTKRERADGDLEWEHDAVDTHFSGTDADGSLLDATENAVPKILLVSGPMRGRGDKKKADPKSLPDGLTVVDLLREHFAARGIGIAQTWSHKGGNQIIAIWNHADWKANQAKRARYKAEKKTERDTAAATITLDEHNARTAQREKARRSTTATAEATATAAATDSDGFTTVKSKRRGHTAD